MHKELEDKLEQMIQTLGCELYDISFLKENNIDILRVSIMAKNGNTTLDVCQEVSELISPLLDVYDPISMKYTLEVSSPGVERLLKTTRHFRHSIGEEVFVKTMDKEEFEAILKSADDKGAVFETEAGEKFYPFEDLKKVKTIFRW
ncbi:ribosome maturation factor [Helicobacter sp. 12S02232-10]|uniref:ribosome maturation factor RimP n=1 Tax=Helicobacter sp. 12S02232-10 TaxID=1476197 RepID=UPI000BA7D121|nr:ribosome maturation factor RimP [Helicobacter sp. 12S02232-10]PAF49264.1 ribosome maturation factor [Helicobacter sp. 12S02232-10]